MGFLYVFLALVLAAFLAAAVLLVVGSIYFDACNSEVPPGVEQPAKLRIIHATLVGTSILGRILENLHISTQIRFVRFVRNGWKPRRKDTALFFKDVKFKHVPVRIYQPKAPSAGQRKGVLYFHGGGFVFGSIRTHENICRYIARESESVVVSVEYRLAPEHTYPAPLNDCLAAATHFLKAADDYGVDRTRIIVAGDSAGGHLAATVCQTLAVRPGLPKVRAQILLYPGLQAVDFNLPSYQQNRAVPILFRERSAFYMLQHLNGNAAHLEEVLEGSHVPVGLRLKYRQWLSADNIPKEFKTRGYKPFVPIGCEDDVYEALKILSSPECSPLLAEDALLRRLPETFILTCEYDVLRDDGLLYKKRLEDNGITVTWHHLSNGFHGVLSFFDGLWLHFPSGKKGMDAIVNFVRSL
ncbi:arylacetamide deacetylase-like 3 [Sceloporus undulatus]|uniref:arylacetamide deacetylase-like 3 n=1 Tax=Sceloporus undulatus TaxID=8520 RepID=UPI001C4C1C81|nr:arylacetamide deacetylase-like 3 [Sceloporus undulatus]